MLFLYLSLNYYDYRVFTANHITLTLPQHTNMYPDIRFWARDLLLKHTTDQSCEYIILKINSYGYDWLHRDFSRLALSVLLQYQKYCPKADLGIQCVLQPIISKRPNGRRGIICVRSFEVAVVLCARRIYYPTINNSTQQIRMCLGL